MISQMCLEDIEALKSEGLEPTPSDIIRLNALACKYERQKSKFAFADAYSLPRIATIADGVWFRQPTIGHEIWLDKVSRFADIKDYDTVLALNAYALSRDSSELPDGDDIASVKKALEEYTSSMSCYMKDQIFAALDYVKNGLHEDDELPERKKKDDGSEDILECIAIGVMHEAQAVMWGMTAAELKRLTRSQVEALVHKAYELHGWQMKGDEQSALGDYYVTLDCIRERLAAKKEYSK